MVLHGSLGVLSDVAKASSLELASRPPSFRYSRDLKVCRGGGAHPPLVEIGFRLGGVGGGAQDNHIDTCMLF